MTPPDAETLPEITLRLTAVAHGGHMVGRTGEGRVVFVRHGLPGELVTVRLTEAGAGASFWRGDVVEVLEAAPGRRDTHPWPAADALLAARGGHRPVGGAEYGHALPEAQRELKRSVVAEQLAHLAGVDWDGRVQAVAEEPGDGTGWRTRLHLDVAPDGTAGMYPHRSDRLAAVAAMPLATDAIQRLQPWSLTVPGAARLDIAAPANGTAPLLHVTLRPHEDPAPVAALRADIGAWGREHGVSVTASAPGTHRPEVWHGTGLVRESLEGDGAAGGGPLAWRVSPTGFWQIHRAAPATLLRAVLTGAGIMPGETVWDLYSGAGLFTLAAARAAGEGGTVLAVEGSAVTAADARHNARAYPGVSVVHGDVARVLSGRGGARRRPGSRRGSAGARAVPRPDVVILDPPRAGAAKEVLATIDAAGPRAILYVACDPAALGRDLGRLRRRGWKATGIQAFDLYPNTHHVEAVAVLRRS